MPTIAILSLLLLTSPGPERGEAPLLGSPFVIKELGLTDAQLDSIRELRFKTKKAQIPIQSEMRIKELTLRYEMQKEEPNERKIMSLADEITSLRARLKKQDLKERLRIRKILTPDQRKKLRELRFKRPRKPMRRRAPYRM